MDAQKYISKLGLVPHPEGGYYKEVYGNATNGKKEISTIYYLLENKEISAFHRLHNVVEIWYYHAGERLNIYVIGEDGNLTVHHLYANNEMQVVIQPEEWFAAEIASQNGFCLVGCAVAPAFTFENFELASKADMLNKFPQHKELIERLCMN